MRFESWKLGRVEGIDLFLHPTFLIVPILAFAQAGLVGLILSLAIFGCVLLHELGHALMASRYGIGTSDITLYPIGGVARLERMPRSAGPELAIAVAGPAVNLAIAGAIWGLLALIGPALADSRLGGLLDALMVMNLVLVGFNMLPIFPMDGGRVFRALLSGWIGRGRATEIAAGVGRFVVVVAGVWFVLNGHIMQAALTAFLFFAGSMELRSVRREERHRANPGVTPEWPAPPLGFRWVTRGDGTYRLAPIVATWSRPDRRPPGSPGPWG